MADDLSAYLDAIRKTGDTALRPCPLVSDEFNPTPPHKVGVAHLIGRGQFLLADGTGLGKTPQVVVAWAYVREQSPETRLLVLCGKSSYFQFADEVERFVPSAVVEVVGWERRGRKRVALDANGRRKQYARFARNQTSVLISTYHTIALDFRSRPHPADPVVWAYPDDWSPFILAMDECHVLRSNTQKLLYPAIWALRKGARAVWGMSATPISTRLMDLYHLYNIIRPGLLGSQHDFTERYLDRELKTIYVKGGRRQKVWVVRGSKNLPELAARIKPYYLRRPPEIIGPYMPGIIIQPKQVTLDPKQAGLYRKVCNKVFPWVKATNSETAARRKAIEDALSEDDSLSLPDGTALSAAVAMGYAQMALDAPEVLGHPAVPSAKFTQLLDWLQNDLANEKVLVYTRYRQVAEAYATKLTGNGVDVGLITGRLSAPQRDEVKRAFQETTSPRVLVINSAGRESLNLHKARIVVFVDLPWSWSEFIQVVGRARRYGSEYGQVTLILLGATLDGDAPTLDDTTLQTLQDRAILVRGTFGLTLAENELTKVSFDQSDTDLTAEILGQVLTPTA